MSAQYGLELARFQLDMARKLEMNSHKNHWSESTVRWLRNRLRQEIVELGKALDDRTPGTRIDNVVSECADVANFAMMIADNVREGRP